MESTLPFHDIIFSLVLNVNAKFHHRFVSTAKMSLFSQNRVGKSGQKSVFTTKCRIFSHIDEEELQ